MVAHPNAAGDASRLAEPDPFVERAGAAVFAVHPKQEARDVILLRMRDNRRHERITCA